MKKRRVLTIRLKHKKLTFLLILLVLPIATICSVNANESEEIDFIYFAYNPYIFLLTNELATKAESLGFTVNAIYYENPYEMIARMYSGDYDIAYGPALVMPYMDTIFQFATSIITVEQQIIFHNDVVFSQIVTDLMNYLYAVESTPEEDLPILLGDILDKAHDAEERLWENQLIIPLGYTADYVPGMMTSMNVYINSQEGRMFENTELRIKYASIIDRTVFTNYWALLPFAVYETNHLYGWTSYHDFDLPNGIAN